MTDGATSQIRIRPLGAPGDLGWVILQHGITYATEYGWDPGFETLVAGIVADHAERIDDPRRAAWIAELDGEPVGCIFCVPTADPEVAQLRLLLVTAAGRGRGLGGDLVATCLAFARRSGHRRVTLWTTDALSSARRLYEAAGFRLVDQSPQHRFGHHLVGQHWELCLTPVPERSFGHA